MTRRSRAPHLILLTLLAAGLCLPTAAEAAWNLFGTITFTGGRAENPRLLDPNQPATLRRGQVEGTTRVTLGTSATWEKTEFEFSYSPYGEFYEESDLSQVSHALEGSWNHRYTPRLSWRLKEDFSYNPELPTDPNGAGLGGALAADTSILASDFKQTLAFKATEKSTLSWYHRNLQRIYSEDQLLDTTGNAVGVEFARILGLHGETSAGYEFGLYSFRDGLPPQFSTTLQSFCRTHPLDPTCLPLLAAAAQPPAEDQDFNRHRVWGGYAFQKPEGLHFDLDGGLDSLVLLESGAGSITKPFMRSSVGWNGSRYFTRVGYEQGLDEGGGILTNAELRRAHADGRARFTDTASLELSASRDVRRGLDPDGGYSGASLITFRGASTFTYKLPAGWALLALFTHDRQTASGTTAVPTEVTANRYAVGASWSFK